MYADIHEYIITKVTLIQSHHVFCDAQFVFTRSYSSTDIAEALNGHALLQCSYLLISYFTFVVDAMQHIIVLMTHYKKKSCI